MRKQYVVTLSDAERTRLRAFLRKGQVSARRIARAHILLLADEGQNDTAARWTQFPTKRCGACSKNNLKPWLKQHWCTATVGADFVWRMEDVLDLYAEPYDAQRPVVCFDELPYQLVAGVRAPQPVAPGRVAREDYEYVRHGTCNLFMTFQPQQGWRHVEVTARRTARDFAHQMRMLVDEQFPNAEVIRVVLDNLNTHTPAALYQAFDAAEARRLTAKLEFHYTPKHGRWLNMVEIEWSVLARQWLDQRLPDQGSVAHVVALWETQRNATRATVDGRLTVRDGRTKLGHRYGSEP